MSLSRLARQCPECPGTARPALQGTDPGLVCDHCGHAWELGRLPSGHQLLLKEWAGQQVSQSLPNSKQPSSASPLLDEVPANKANTPSKEREAFTKRYWLKAQHIELLSLAHGQRKTVEQHDDEGRLVQVIWHHPKSDEARRFRSTLELRQHRKRAERKPKVVWVKEEELAAAAKAQKENRTIELGPNGESGRVEFHPKNSEMAKKYLAQICVIRKLR